MVYIIVIPVLGAQTIIKWYKNVILTIILIHENWKKICWTFAGSTPHRVKRMFGKYRVLAERPSLRQTALESLTNDLKSLCQFVSHWRRFGLQASQQLAAESEFSESWLSSKLRRLAELRASKGVWLTPFINLNFLDYSTIKPRLSVFQGTIIIFAIKRGYLIGGIL